jgi:hypothetical protein
LKIIESNSVQVIPHNKQFRFDHVFDTESRQQDVFTNVGDPLVRKFIEGYNVTILAYVNMNNLSFYNDILKGFKYVR